MSFYFQEKILYKYRCDKSITQHRSDQHGARLWLRTEGPN